MVGSKASTSSSILLRVIRNVEELEEVRDCWESWQHHPNCDFAQFKLVCQLRSEVERPHVVVVECNGRPQALLAARLERTRLELSIGYLKSFRIPARVLAVLYQGLLGGVEEEIGRILVQHLWTLLRSGEADAVTFHQLPEDSPLWRALTPYEPKWLGESGRSWTTHWEMALPEQEGFLQHRVRSKHRSWIRKKQRELESAFPDKVSWRWRDRFDDVPGLCARLEQVAVRSYQRKLGAGFRDDEDHRERLALFARRGQLRVQVLEIDGAFRAFWIGTVYGGTFHSSATAYDPDLRGFEPGTLIFIRMVDGLIREGIRKLDFGLGDAHYKQRFGDRCWREATVRLFAPTPKGRALRYGLALCATIDATGRRLLQRAGLLDRLKTGWRRRLTSATPEGGER